MQLFSRNKKNKLIFEVKSREEKNINNFQN